MGEQGEGDGDSEPRKIVFMASLPDIQSAIKRGGDGMRIQLDVPETEVLNAIKMVVMTKRTFRVTIESVKADDRPKHTNPYKSEY